MPYPHSSRLPAAVALRSRSAARRRGSRVEQPAARRWYSMRVVVGEVELAQLDLAVRPGQLERAGDGAAVVVLLDQRQRAVSRVGDAGR